VERILEAFAGVTEPSPWSVRGFNQFVDADNYVIFLDVVPSEKARQVHADLLDRLRSIASMQWERFDGPDLHYHVTVANKGLTAANFAAVWSFVNSRQAPDFDLSFDSLTLLKIKGDAHTVYKTFRLTGRANS
jgi:2'-5' RNA ligase